MKIIDTRVYRGPNLYALRPVIRLRVDLGELEDYPTAKLPGFVDRLLELMPTLREHTCSYQDAGGFVRRMTEEEGTWLGHVLEHVAIELQPDHLKIEPDHVLAEMLRAMHLLVADTFGPFEPEGGAYGGHGAHGHDEHQHLHRPAEPHNHEHEHDTQVHDHEHDSHRHGEHGQSCTR